MDSHLLEDCEVLEVEPGISPKELKRAYHDMLKVWHPDRFPSDSALATKAEEKTKRINLAYERLQAFLSTGAGKKQEFNSHGDQTANQAENMFRTGIQYLMGNGVPLNYEEAVIWLQRSVDQGYAPAKDALGWCYGNGLGVPVNPERAFQLFEQSANEGYVGAEWKVGCSYELGLGVQINKKEAVKWYYRSAGHGDPEGQYRLGQLLLVGEGVLQNITEAQQWFGKASEAGHTKATEELNRLRGSSQTTPAGAHSASHAGTSTNTKTSGATNASDEAAGVGCMLLLILIAVCIISGISLDWLHISGKGILYVCIGIGGFIVAILGRKK